MVVSRPMPLAPLGRAISDVTGMVAVTYPVTMATLPVRSSSEARKS